MKKAVLFSLLPLVFVLAGCSTSNNLLDDAVSSTGVDTISIESDVAVENPVVRNVKWGMSRNEVMKAEKISSSDIIENDADMFAIRSTIGNVKYYLIYSFEDEKLWQVTYMIDNDNNTGLSPSNASYYNEFERVKDLLSEKYGPITGSDQVWLSNNEFMKANPDYYGMAMLQGELRLNAVWERGDTTIQLGCGPKSQTDLTLMLMYYNTEVNNKKKDVNKQETLNDI